MIEDLIMAAQFRSYMNVLLQKFLNRVLYRAVILYDISVSFTSLLPISQPQAFTFVKSRLQWQCTHTDGQPQQQAVRSVEAMITLPSRDRCSRLHEFSVLLLQKSF